MITHFREGGIGHGAPEICKDGERKGGKQRGGEIAREKVRETGKEGGKKEDGVHAIGIKFADVAAPLCA